MKQKQKYVRPETAVFEVKSEGVICSSPFETMALFTGFGTEEDWSME